MFNIKAVSQKMGATGGTQSELFSNVVSSSDHLDRWAVFARETIQNSNDQRLSGSKPITYDVNYQFAGKEALALVRGWLQSPGPHCAVRDLELLSAADDLDILYVADSATAGLNGGTDPQSVSSNSNFCNFFFFAGQLESKTSGGGSFGIGRNVLFMASKIKTIVVYSRFIEDGVPRSRFMAMATSGGYHYEGQNYTGKHWWGAGDPRDENSILPVEGTFATEIARILGLEQKLRHESGTVIGVLCPDISDLQLEMQTIADSLLVNAWPHFISENGQRSIDASVKFINTSLEIPDPLAWGGPVARHAQAYLEAKKLQRQGSLTDSTLRFNGSLDHLQRFHLSSKNMGNLTWNQTFVDEEPDGLERYEAAGLAKGASSIALIRSAGLVVKYLPIEPANRAASVQGVFLSSPEYDSVFRKSENVTHDDWIPSRLNLQQGQRNPVSQTISQIASRFNSSANRNAQNPTNLGTALDLANSLGKLLVGIGVQGGAQKEKGSKNPGRSKNPIERPKIKEIDSPKLLSRDSKYTTGSFDFVVEFPAEVDNLRRLFFRANLGVWLGNGNEIEPPIGLPQARVVSYATRSADSTAWTVGSTAGISIADIESGTHIRVVAEFPNDIQLSCTPIIEIVD